MRPIGRDIIIGPAAGQFPNISWARFDAHWTDDDRSGGARRRRGTKRSRGPGTGADRRTRHPLHLLSVRFCDGSHCRERYSRRSLGTMPNGAFSSFMVRQPICFSTVTETTLAMVLKHQNSWEFPIPRRLFNSLGRAHRSVFCTLFRNREEGGKPGGFLTSDCRGNFAASFMKNSQMITGFICGTAPSRR